MHSQLPHFLVATSSVSEAKLTSCFFPNLLPHFVGVVLVVLYRDEGFVVGVVERDAAVLENEFGGFDERATRVVMQ